MTEREKVHQPPDHFCDSEEDIREVRPFYWVLTVVMVILYGWSVVSSPELQALPRLIPYTALMLVHVGLHWVSPYLTTRRRWLLPYFVVQGALIFVLNLIASQQGVTLGLYLAIAGEAVGILENVRLSAIAVIGYMALSAVNFGVAFGWRSLLAWLVVMTPMAFFVVVYVAMFVRQAKARERAQALLRELESAHRQLAEYAARVEDLTLAAERQRMARELHDTLSQGLAGLILQLEAADAHLSEGRPDRAGAIVRQTMERARATLADARRAIGDLRDVNPPDLAEAVRAEADRFTDATGIPCTLHLNLSLPIPDAIREHALRAVAEGLTNIARHAQASQARLKLATADGQLEIEIHDDGIGFDPEEAADRAGHYGLLGMRERARLAGGAMEVSSKPGEGTVLSVKLPIKQW